MLEDTFRVHLFWDVIELQTSVIQISFISNIDLESCGNFVSKFGQEWRMEQTCSLRLDNVTCTCISMFKVKHLF